MKVVKTYEAKYKRNNMVKNPKEWMEDIMKREDFKLDVKSSGLCTIDDEVYEFVELKLYVKVK